MRAHLPILPVVLPLLGGLLQPIAGFATARAAWGLALGASLGTALAAAAGLHSVLVDGAQRYSVGSWPPPWGIEVVLDPLSAFTATVIAVVSTLTVAAGPLAARRAYGRETPAFYALALIFLAGLEGMVVSGDLFNVFVFLEVASISSYALIASGGGAALAAAFRYLVLGTAGASFYLLGVGCLYAATGTLNMADLAERLPAISTSPLVGGAAAFLIVGLGLKIALFPLHGWLPDAYGRAPAVVAAFIAPVGTKAAAYVLARILLYVVRPDGDLATGALAWGGGVAVIWGGVRAIRQADARRLLAYSSISQLGYVALGLGLANQNGLVGAYLQIGSHALAKAALFVVLMATALAGQRPLLATLRIGRAMPVTGSCAVVAALSMVGVPPAGGFFAKWYLLQGALAAGQPLLAVAIVAGGLLALAYMARFTAAVWVGETPAPGAPPEAPRTLLAALVLLAALGLALGLANAPLVSGVLVPAAAGALR
jgi:multicomponent Na+:H+ antiporter subunit D